MAPDCQNMREGLLPSRYVLGLDIGIKSCGWALLDFEAKRIIAMGVRLWDVPQGRAGQSLAAVRRSARSSRRNTKRTRDRKKHCLKLLIGHGVIPEGVDASWIQSRKGDEPVIKLRAAALNRLLSGREFAQIMYSIASHRGYISHGEDDADTEGKKVKGSIAENAARKEDLGFKTVGEMLASLSRSRNHPEDSNEYWLCVSNQQLIEEVQEIFNVQRGLGSAFASVDLEGEYIDCLTWEKDTTGRDAIVYSTVGVCSYYLGMDPEKNPEIKRAASSCYSSELCAAHERLCNVVWIDECGVGRQLPWGIRQQAIKELFSPIPIKGNKECKVRYSRLRKWLDKSIPGGIHPDVRFKGIDPENESSVEVYEPKAWRILRANLDSEIMIQLAQDRPMADGVCSAVTYASSRQSLRERIERLGLDVSESQFEQLCNLPYSSKVFNGYGSRCLASLDKLIGMFEEGEEIASLAQAEEACGLKGKRRDCIKRSDKLPPYKEFDPTCNNPVVLRFMGQVRKVVNAVVQEYGIPFEVHVELARDLKHSKAERQRIEKNNKRANQEKTLRREKIAEHLNCSPEDRSVYRLEQKVRHYEEQGGFCPYCGGSISLEELIRDSSLYQIDHILPYSRSGIDDFTNKVLVHSSCNEKKGNKTPYEWFSEERQWAAFCARVKRLGKLSHSKIAKLTNTDFKEKESDFISRNLNDTRYASRSAKNYIEHYLKFPEDGKQHVYAVSGAATAILRKGWGISKDRSADNLHHAVDAAVIAACTPGNVQRIAKASEQKFKTPKERRKDLFNATQPWEGFVDQVLEKAQIIVPTRKTNHGVTGKVYEDTLYRYKGLNPEGAKGLLCSASGEVSLSSNYRVFDNGAARKVGGFAFLRLWWDPEKMVRGKKAGGYLLEPVYYADIPFLQNGYIPRTIPPRSNKKPREKWDVLPDRLKSEMPLVLFPGDMIEVRGNFRRFKGVDIDGCAWVLCDPLEAMDPKAATKGLTVTSLKAKEEVRLVNEDVLGMCYSD